MQGLPSQSTDSWGWLSAGWQMMISPAGWLQKRRVACWLPPPSLNLLPPSSLVRRNSAASRRWETALLLPAAGGWSPFWSLSHTTAFQRSNLIKFSLVWCLAPGGRLREKHSLHSETPFQCKIQLLGCDLLSKQVVCSLDNFQKQNILNDINHQNLWSLYPLLVAKQTEGQISSSSSPPYMGPTSALVRTSVCARNCPIHFNHPTPNHIFLSI